MCVKLKFILFKHYFAIELMSGSKIDFFSRFPPEEIRTNDPP